MTHESWHIMAMIHLLCLLLKSPPAVADHSSASCGNRVDIAAFCVITTEA
jgi:hypothetical protein